MKLSRKLLYLFCAGLIFGSCVRDKDALDCSQGCNRSDITVAVMDKTYANAASIPGLAPENSNLPFLSYINRMSLWWLRKDIGNGQLHQVQLQDREITHLLDVSFIPNGDYEIVLIGNENLSEITNQADNIICDLHPDNSESRDIYIGGAAFSFPISTGQTVWLYRSKGKLLIDFINLPSGITQAEILVSNVCKTINKDRTYTDATSVFKSFDLTPASAGSPLGVLLAPSIEGANSTLTIDLLDSAMNKTRLSNIPLTIMRNEITLIRPAYNANTSTWELSALINDQWVRIHDMTVENTL